jgi:hypothetical protein
MKGMESAIFLEKISIAPPATKIYQRLGFKKKTTQLSANKQKETDHYIEEAASLISLQGSFLRLSINNNDGQSITLSDGGLTFVSAKLSAFLHDCPEAALLGATAGSAIMKAIAEKTSQSNLTAAVVYDATASEMTDAALDWMMDYLNQLIRREGKILLPRRFSAGYADFDLKNQKVIYKKLQMEKIGVIITDEFILLPEKSVTAVCGICG